MLKWFKEHQRKLPWRENYEPYQVWISEIMLQQTQVKTMLPFYRRWMEALPGIREVAEADEELLIKLWEGLGYYRRVRNIRKTAEMICNENGGQFPEQVAVVETSWHREVHRRCHCQHCFQSTGTDPRRQRDPCPLPCQEDRRSASTWRRREGTLEARRSLDSKREARNFNQALMELGATVCLPSSPNCLLCPIRQHCLAFELGKVEAIPHQNRARSPDNAIVHVP